MAINLSDILHNRPAVTPTIYAYIVTNMPDHDGYIKVGFTDRDVETRIKEQTHTVGAKYKILFSESAMRPDGTCFTDKDVHNVLKRKRFKQLYGFEDANEWFKCSESDVRAAISEIKMGIRMEGVRTWAFPMRKEQQRAVNETSAYFRKIRMEEPDEKPKYLWNAKMRFGKTFATYQLAKKMDMKRILVLTFKPAVESAWQEDLSHHVDFEGWQFVSNKEAKFDSAKIDTQFENCNKDKPIVVFGSFQDLLGTNDAGGIKAKNEFIHREHWDMVVFDEYHFGAWRDNAKKLFSIEDEEEIDFDPEVYQNEEAGNAINETWLRINTNYYLYLSGTPFRALNRGEFLEDQIFNWTYSDEQNEKEKWNVEHPDEPNPYAALPKMIMLTYKVPESITGVAVNEGYDEFDINEFFKAKHEEKDVENAKFVYEDYVQKWIKLIQGEYNPVDTLKMGSDKPPMPFSDATLLNVLSHTIWFLPSIASCYAMYNLLRQKQNTFFNDYKIIVCAGTKAGIGLDALAPVQEAMGDPLQTKTITLTCGKLTTGVTVKPWSGIFMLRNLKSPEMYFQAAFRVQSPWVVRDDSDKNIIMKEECYVFDFALERALKQIADYSCDLKIDDGATPESKVADFIHFLPVLAFDGAAMNAISAQDVLDITYAGTSATLLAKRWQTALLVHVDNDTLKKLQANPEVLEALMNLEGFRALNSEIETIINRSENVKKVRKEKGDNMTPSEKRQISEEEKQAKSLRKQVQENLLKLAARIPAFMYLTDFREQTVKDVIRQLEPELFQKVTGLTVKIFDELNSIGLFDSEKMNQGIFGFRRYENASLSYTGIDMHEGEDVGGWDTVLRKEEYDALYKCQQATLANFEEIIISDNVPDTTVKKPDVYSKPLIKQEEQKKESQMSVVRKSAEPEKPVVDWEKVLADIKVGTVVHHKLFGDGVIADIYNNNKYIKVKFGQQTKMFVFPDAFIKEHLTLTE